MDIKTIKENFETEFKMIRDKFQDPIELNVEGKGAPNSKTNKPGVYVIWHDDCVIKVGRHLVNSIKRALQHLVQPTPYKDENRQIMNSLNRDIVRIILFNVNEEKDKHWVAALEIYFEQILNPKIKSKRLG